MYWGGSSFGERKGAAGVQVNQAGVMPVVHMGKEAINSPFPIIPAAFCKTKKPLIYSAALAILLEN